MQQGTHCAGAGEPLLKMHLSPTSLNTSCTDASPTPHISRNFPIVLFPGLFLDVESNYRALQQVSEVLEENFNKNLTIK